MRILVTGGAGFIGSNLVKALVDRGDEVTVLDDFSVGRMEHLEDINPKRLEVISGSVCDLELMRKLITNTDTVFHLAVQCLVACNHNPVLAQQVNVGGTFNVCLAACEAHAKVVYISSSEIYGTCKISPMAENHPIEPQSIYGLSKLISEQYVRSFHKYHNLPAVIIRPFNAYGPNHRNDQYAAVITSFINRLEKGEPLIIEGTGEQSRDFTYVSDIVDGIILLSTLENGEAINVGNGYATTIKDLAATLFRIYNMKENIIYKPERINNVFKLESDIKRANSYGYEPKVSLEEGLKKYISWLRKNNGR